MANRWFTFCVRSRILLCDFVFLILTPWDKVIVLSPHPTLPYSRSEELPVLRFPVTHPHKSPFQNSTLICMRTGHGEIASIFNFASFFSKPNKVQHFMKMTDDGHISYVDILISFLFPLQVLMPHSILLSLSLYSGFSVLGIITVLLLPIETKGRALQVKSTAVQYCVFITLPQLV